MVSLVKKAVSKVLVWHVRLWPIEENNLSTLMIFIVSFAHN